MKNKKDDVLKKLIDLSCEESKIELCKMVKQFRLGKKLSQAQFAENIGVSSRTILRIEKCEIFTLSMLCRIKLIYPEFGIDLIFSKYHDDFEKKLYSTIIHKNNEV